MYRIYECITQQHNQPMVILAVMVGVTGACLTALLLRRVATSRSRARKGLVVLTSVISAVTIWATHFIAMLAFDSGMPHGYDPYLTTLSLAIAVIGTMATNFTIVLSQNKWRFLHSGILFGTTVSIMHYLGMSAYVLPGDLVWNPSYVLASVVLGTGLGAIAYHRIEFPVTRLCWLGAAIAMVLAICSMHFVGMSAFTIELSPLIETPDQAISELTLGFVVSTVVATLFLMGFAALFIEQSMLSENRRELRSVSLHDGLTGLPNRSALFADLEAWTRTLADTPTQQLTVFTVNLDTFKNVNELYARGTGDLVLTEVTQRLQEEAGPSADVYRVASDEFVILAGAITRTSQGLATAERILSYLKEPFESTETPLLVTASVGAVSSVTEGRDAESLMRKSAIAMFFAKSNSDQKAQCFNPDMEAQSRSRLELQNDLRHAVSRNQFHLVYQKQNILPSRNLVGFEVLLRWTHPERGFISPAEFIPIAEETGMIRDIGLWVLRTACKEAAGWQEPLSIAVNVAPQQLIQPSFIETVSDILFETRLPPNRLELEITEASIIDDQDHALRVVHQLKVMGIKIAMDDFGTGYSSLATLQAFPFDKIKIDRSFVQDVHLTPQRAAIVRATVLIGQAMDIPVLAEGCETDEELEFLEQEGCSTVQGFYFGKPLSVEDMRKAVIDCAQARSTLVHLPQSKA